MSFFAAAANLLIALSGFMARRRLEKSSRNVFKAQEELLLSMIRNNTDTDYGRKYDFASITSVKDYFDKVPLIDYEDIQEFIIKEKEGKSSVLTKEAVEIFEPTSGSTSSSKYIPYTKTTLAQFQEAIGAWLWDIYSNRRALLRGPSYWCVTPLSSREGKTSGGIAIGFEDDSDYFGAFRKVVLNYLTVVPKTVSLIEGREAFQYTTLLFLLGRKDLSLISLWSPTFILSLIQPFEKWREQLAADLEAGTLTPPVSVESAAVNGESIESRSVNGESIDPLLKKRLERLLKKRPLRALEIRKCASISSLWPQLSFISVWASASAKEYIGEVKSMFPHSELQPKGLLSTEGFVSFPLTNVKGGSVLAVNSHFFDFVEQSADRGKAVTADEAVTADKAVTADILEEGKTYSVNITTGSGLYRYKTHDKILVTGFYNDLPVVEFMGRDNAVADWFGEKLNPDYVSAVIDLLFKGEEYSFALLALEKGTALPETVSASSYVLWIDSPRKGLISSSESVTEPDILSERVPETSKLSEQLERELCKSHHYLGCRRLGQLEPASVRFLRPGTGMETYIKRLLSEGIREGDIKPSLVDSVRTNWSNFFELADDSR
jgi:hypothetical protein